MISYGTPNSASAAAAARIECRMAGASLYVGRINDRPGWPMLAGLATSKGRAASAVTGSTGQMMGLISLRLKIVAMKSRELDAVPDERARPEARRGRAGE